MLEKNLGIWSRHYNCTPHEYKKQNGIEIHISRVKEGVCKVTLSEYEWGFSVKKTILIDDLFGFKAWAETVRDGLIKWTDKTTW